MVENGNKEFGKVAATGCRKIFFSNFPRETEKS
jgi:hypothetical protein